MKQTASANRLFLILSACLPKAKADKPADASHAASATPRESSLPPKETRNSRKKSTWADIAIKPITITDKLSTICRYYRVNINNTPIIIITAAKAILKTYLPFSERINFNGRYFSSPAAGTITSSPANTIPNPKASP